MDEGFEDLFSQEEVLRGLQGRRARKLLFLIESRTLYLMAQMQRAVDILLAAGATGEIRSDFLQQYKAASDTPVSLTLNDLERYASQWAGLVPAGAEIRAAIINLLARKYTLAAAKIPYIRTTLGFDDPAVDAAFRQSYGKSPATLLETRSVLDELPLWDDADGVEGRRDAEMPVRNALAAELEWVALPGGAVLATQGSAGDGLYLLMSGRLRILARDADGAERVVREVAPGEIAGETAVLTDMVWPYSVRAIRDSELVKLTRAGFDRLVEQHPRSMLQLTRSMVTRLPGLAPARGGKEEPGTICIIPIGSNVPVADFLHELVESFAGLGPVLHLNSRIIDDRLEMGAAQTQHGDADNAMVVNWLNEQESKFRYVIYESDPEPTPWTNRCLRQADRIVLVGRSDGVPAESAIEAAIDRLHMPAMRDLVLLHPDSTSRPAGTRSWLERRNLHAHYHIRLHRGSDMQRLVRRLTGRAVGLVLGGGGARGFAHIGVLRALEEAGVPVDLIGGTSMGALMGGMYAAGYSCDGIREVSKIFANSRALFDYTFPLVSFLASGKLTAMLHQIFINARIEDLWQSYYCISSNLTQARPVLHTQGLLWKAVRASVAIPGIFSPVLHEGDVLVDGGVLNNLPVDIMQQIGGGPVIAVNVSVEQELSREFDFGHSISGWDVLRNRISPLAPNPKVPYLLTSLMRVIELNHIYMARERPIEADLYIAPPLNQFAILDFKSYEEIMEIGYETARPAIAAWLKQDSSAGK